MGYANVQCARASFENQRISLYCPQGRVKTIKEFGILPAGSKDRDSCYKTESNSVCTDLVNPKSVELFMNEISQK